MDVLSWIGAGLGIIISLGAMAQYFRGSADKGTITSLQSSVLALKEENSILRSQMTDLKTRLTTAELRADVLEKVVTQTVEIARLQETLDEHHRESVAVLVTVKTDLDLVREYMRGKTLT